MDPINIIGYGSRFFALGYYVVVWLVRCVPISETHAKQVMSLLT